MAILSGVAGVFAVPVLAALRLDTPWLLPSAWSLFGLVGLEVYRRTLPAAARLLDARREQLLGAVCGDDA